MDRSVLDQCRPLFAYKIVKSEARLHYFTNFSGHNRIDQVVIVMYTIFQMIEGYPPFSQKQENEVPKVYAAKRRPPFRAPAKCYAHGLKE